MGRRTIIFEEQTTVGGKAQNYYENGLAFYLGPLLVDNASYPETMKIVNAVDVPVRSSVSTSTWMFNWTTGETWAAPSSELSASQFAEEVQRYRLYWESDYEPFARSLYTNSVPEALTVSTSEWFSTRDYPILQSRITRLLISWGYGDANEVPILYTLGVFSPYSLGGYPGLVVFERYSQQLTTATIHLGSKILSIDRPGDNVTIHYGFHPQSEQSRGGLSLQTCSDVIMAFPPTTRALQHAGLELSSDESTVFSAVETSNYFAGAIRLNIPPMSSFKVASISPTVSADIAGEPVLAQGMYSNSSVSITYSLAASGQHTNQVKKIALETLSRINTDPQEAGEIPIPVTLADIEDFRHYPGYFPHFNLTRLQEGWYEKFTSLQGSDRTYYTSGLNRVEHVEFVIQAARDLVEGHFAP
ncbi:hypothetical protein BDW59DRAFT_164349 [Aspergillus cavernicola]|uniref:Amine oxidase domain-containing protein n=1 Tax=Aspergillus cavernicola TaxID=176166 RepID=A0ABR4HZL5_9EURO